MRSERSIRVYLTSEEHDRLTAAADERGLSGSAFIRSHVLSWLNRHPDAGGDPREPAEGGE